MTRRQASTGPIPVSSTSTSASGVVRRLNQGGPTLASVPVTASEISGKKVPQKITSAERHQHQVVEQEEGLAREQRVEPRLASAGPAARLTISATETDHHDPDEDQELHADRGGAEGVDRVEDPRAHEERAEQREHERGA